ncbi:MFS transporter [Gynurincola endophyticus]|uniref:MFS transporter n=1 Tax=Gynurincola endophyticus TaxID=2479004 RepID=UPI000F8C3C7D|nr:MFS transporter [Gynurincola endophyticus]
METSLTNSKPVQTTVYAILLSISFSHMLNDLIQSVVPSIYPMLKDEFRLSFSQIGLITFVFQITASLLQPFVGRYTDKHPYPYSLAIGMSFTFLGLILLAFAHSFPMILIAVSCIGMGSSVFHPEASRVAQIASGGKKGLAQSIFQVGGNAGSAIGPLLAAWIIIPHGQSNVAWFAIFALLAIFVLMRIGNWYKVNLQLRKTKVSQVTAVFAPGLTKGKVYFSLFILLVLIFSKYFYMASMSSYFTFYLIEKFNVSIQESQIYLFVFLFAVAAGTIIGGPLGDKYGRKKIIWVSILGAAPFTLLLPHVGLVLTIVLAAIIGVIIASAFSAILVYATDLVPGKVGMIAGLFFGFAFGMGGLGSAVLGSLADKTSIEYVFHICAFLPLLGIVTAFLPDVRNK